MRKAVRAIPDGYDKVTNRTHPELRYLRWDYFVKAPNVSDKVINSKEKLIKACARKYFKKFRYEFSFMGFDVEDLENMGRVYLVSALGFEDGQTSDKAIASFINQRFIGAANIIRNYNREEAVFKNITVYRSELGVPVPGIYDFLNTRMAPYRWRTLGWSEYKAIEHLFDGVHENGSLVTDGTSQYVLIKRDGINEPFIKLNSDGGDGAEWLSNNENPESILIDLEEASLSRSENKAKKATGKKKRSMSIVNYKKLLDLFYKRSVSDRNKFIKRLESWSNSRIDDISKKTEINKIIKVIRAKNEIRQSGINSIIS